MKIIFVVTITGTALAVLFLALFFIIRYVAKNGMLTEKNNRKMAGSVISKAIVLSWEKTGVLINNRPEVKIQVQVTPERGRNFVVEIKDTFSPEDTLAVHTGSTIQVQYNPAHHKEIFLAR
jgi:hypothetical protein